MANKKQKLVLDKYVENKFYVSVEQLVKSAWGGDIWEYSFQIRCASTAVFSKLRRIAKKEGYLSIQSVSQEEDKAVKEDNYWNYTINGIINGGSPFEHTNMLKDLVRIIQ